ncbi:hypothetical protein L1286_08935 [Pseudoalteromonas sp. SMS1]|uniref:hypothetical protein n=1 Tax=Pseudoalteromonas sp. SMS1 TaxID=2908894 RepID=UPI001F3E855A|nr:hypothetical protein [Pseudoalteromonas sp. SMS1]MCF2857593.1 hypothetical protein [Pseudoalteromonas sp. SMS1]
MNIQWGRILIVGFLIEVLAIVFLSFINPAFFKLPLTHESVSVGLFFAALIAAFIVCFKLQKDQLVNGILVGIWTVLVYVIISVSAELAGLFQNDYDMEYFVKHLAKIAGGAVGALITIGLVNRANVNKAATN